MKKVMVFLLMLCMLSPTAMFAAADSNIPEENSESVALSNQGFETHTNTEDCPDDWICSSKKGGAHSLVDNPAHRGSWSLMTDNANQKSETSVKQVVYGVTPGVSYTASIWHRTNGVSASPYIHIVFLDAAGEELQGQRIIAAEDLPPTHDWKEINGTVTAPDGAAALEFRLIHKKASGTVYWDSASFEPAGNLLVNAGFESGSDQWQSSGTGNVVVDNGEAAEGQRSIHLNAAPGEKALLEQNRAASGGRWYRLQAEMMTDDAEQDALLEVEWRSENGSEIGRDSLEGASAKWSSIAKDVRAPEGAVELIVRLIHEGSGDSWWDMVSVMELPLVEDFGPQTYTLHTNNAAYSGPYAYTVTTLGYNLGKIDLRDGSLVNLLQANFNSLGTMVHSNGKVYLTSNGMQEYDPATGVLRSLNLPTNCRRLNNLYEHTDSKIWGSCYNPSNLFSYDPATGDFQNYGEIDEEHSYLWDVIEYKDVFFLSLGSPGILYQYDPATGEKTKILTEVMSDSKHVRGIRLYGDRLFVKRVAPDDTYVLDADTLEIVTHLENVHGDTSSPDANNRVYWTYNGNLNYYDLDDDTFGLVQTSHQFPNAGTFGVVQLGEPDFPGDSYAAIQNAGTIFVWNPVTDAYKLIQIDMPSAPSKTYQLTVGDDGKVYGVGVQGAGSFRVDPNHPTVTETFDGPGQAEGMAALGDYIYFGNYPSAVFYRQNVNEPWNPEYIFDLKDTKQNRPVSMIEHEGKIYIGTIADRGYLTGSLAIYDPATGEVEEYHGLSPDQSITSVAVKDQYVYLGTTIHGGLSSSPATEEGKVIVFNLITGQVEASVVPVQGQPVVGAVTIGPEGNLWGIAGGELFILDTTTNTISSTQTLYGNVEASHDWGVYDSILLSEDGNVYGSAGMRLFKLDPDQNLTTLFQSETVRRVVEDHQGRLWFSGGPDQTLFRYNK